jgi:hypothetical protein
VLINPNPIPLSNAIKGGGGKVNYRVLTHVHDVVPYSDSTSLEASGEDIKLFISTLILKVSSSFVHLQDYIAKCFFLR